MPEEPLIFVEVALCAELPSSVQDILSDGREPTPEKEIEYAVFYSISNCQQGLAGISFGHSLIKTVVAELSQERPKLKHFITLSPVPNFARWLARQNIQDGPDMQPAEAFLAAHPEEVRALGAYYLLQAKRENDMPVDPVARFHLGNGASLYQIHEGADLSARGQKQSYGLMVNYLYEREKLIENHEKFVKDGDIKAQPKLHEVARKYKDKLSENHDR
jgi:malonyl-CoA decarboxylase